MVSLRRARPGLTDSALAAAAVLVVTWIAAAYGTDGPAATVAALILAPMAVLATRRLGERVGGMRLGLASAVVYLLLPWLGTIYALSTYRETFKHAVLPDLVGLRATPWFALGVVLAAAAAFRLVAPAFLVAAIVSLALGTGDLTAIRNGLHETVWSITLLEWLAIAGLAGAARGSRLISLSLAAWLVAAILHGSRVGYGDEAFWQSLSVAAPAIAVTLASLALLVPPFRSRVAIDAL